MQRGVKIEWDPESTSLEVRTNSVLGSNDKVDVYFFSAEGESAGVHFAGGVGLYFTTTPLQYQLGWCSASYTNLPVTPPSADDKVWRITLTRISGIRLVIHCNDVEVLNTLISQATCSYSGWSTIWNREVTKIEFTSGDRASDYYKTGD